MRVILTLLLLLAPLAHAQEECTLDSKLLKPQFAARLPRGFKLVPLPREPRKDATKEASKEPKKDTKKELKQILKLPDGFEATITLGGCSHVIWTIALKGPGLTTKTVGSELVAIAKRELPQLPMDKDSTIDVKLMIQALDEARISVIPAELPCGDAECSLALDADEVKARPAPKAKSKKDTQPPPPAADPPGIIKLSYDKPI